MSTLAPIVLFVYNRADHTEKTLQALKNNNLAPKSELFIYSDAAKNEASKAQVNKVRRLISQLSGFKRITIIEQENNKGLANSVISGVTEVVNKYEKVIVIEDDLVTSPYFLEFMNKALDYYFNHEKVNSITGFNYPLKIGSNYGFGSYIYSRPSSKSWGIWKSNWNNIEFNEHKILERWEREEIKEKSSCYGSDLYKMFVLQMDGKIDSWAIRFAINQIMLNAYTAYPVVSYVKDIGDDSGTHANQALPHKITLAKILNLNFSNECNTKIERDYRRYLQCYFFNSRIFALKNRVLRLFE